MVSWDKVDEGFTHESFKVFKIKSNDCKCSGKKLYCSLMLDEMHIQNQLGRDSKHIHGFSSISKNSSVKDPKLKVATQVLVILVVAPDASWKVPIVYFFHKGLNGQNKANLVLESLKLFEIGKNHIINCF